MKRKKYEKIIQNIENHDNIFIFHHIRPDGDCLGAQQGFGYAIAKRFPKKKVFFIGDNENIFNFLNFHFDNENLIQDEFFQNSLAITVDTADIKRIKKLDFFLNSNFKTRIKIDHHPDIFEEIYNEKWVDPTFSAASEMIGYLLMEENWEINSEISKFIYLGILTDSGRFLFPSTTSRTFQVAAFLMKFNFDFAKLNWFLSNRTEQEVAFYAEVLANYKKKDKVLWYFVSKEIQNKFKLRNDQLSAVNILANIGDARIWLFLIEMENGIRVRIRSNGPKVNKIASEYGGGGHEYAAGINLEKSEKTKEISQEIIDKLVIQVKEFEQNE
ncbi:DHH family phosphoesterase [Mesomycoplasma hyopneumoniae]|uniref:Bifunctional oligoribonuclease/PAP phosphatase NrnA n=1 Tax=Mesomycoplasma hyopneumoniae TaxID=2099 RepID=A0ABD4SUV1_MESHO|nr:bifunctional oligoribonuclease/PAP phosphatase NrnA [Mesomycoplasma hyopneumoniae]MCI8283047.1 bifunctional oligoribonuclease/PAP phosphatase NrnA [Mesomycoplasma hyopneumoniae]MCI8298625.1 bifunctional oligoribonuclease/PAP phosphatase NrnA [Mesomycoplasma hyopneumoniae]